MDGGRTTPPEQQASEPLAGLNPRRQAFVAAYANPLSPTFGIGAQSAVAAGYSPERARVTASELVADRNVRSSIEAILDAAITPQELASTMADYFRDSDRKVRSASVRAGEILMRARRMIGPDTEVSVDARTVLLPQLPAASLEALLAQLEGGESR